MINKEEFRKFAVKGQGIGGHIVDKYISIVESMSVPNIDNMTPNFI
jgi:ATP-dependent Clp protease protease subunit